MIRQEIYKQIDAEREWQQKKHGEFNATLSPLDLEHIVFMTEELGEAAQALLDARRHHDDQQLFEDLMKAYDYELTQVAALAVQTKERLRELNIKFD